MAARHPDQIVEGEDLDTTPSPEDIPGPESELTEINVMIRPTATTKTGWIGILSYDLENNNGSTETHRYQLSDEALDKVVGPIVSATTLRHVMGPWAEPT